MNQAEVLAALTDEWQTLSEVAAKVPVNRGHTQLYHRGRVSEALCVLANQGYAEWRPLSSNRAQGRMWRRAQ